MQPARTGGELATRMGACEAFPATLFDEGEDPPVGVRDSSRSSMTSA